MALSWIESIFNFFGHGPAVKQPSSSVVEVSKAPEKVLTEIEQLIKKFDPRTDMIVISNSRYASLTEGERSWLDSLKNRVFYFTDSTLVNIAIVRAR